MATFGRPLREEHFLFDKDYVPLNHGSFGTFPKSVADRLTELAAQNEARPDTYIRYEFPSLLEESRQMIAKILNTEPSTIVFLPNSTTAVNTVLRSLVWEKGDVILTCSLSNAIGCPSNSVLIEIAKSIAVLIKLSNT